MVTDHEANYSDLQKGIDTHVREAAELAMYESEQSGLPGNWNGQGDAYKHMLFSA